MEEAQRTQTAFGGRSRAALLLNPCIEDFHSALVGRSTWWFSGHGDATLQGEFVPAFAINGALQTVSIKTLIDMVRPHAVSGCLKRVIFTGCCTLQLGKRLHAEACVSEIVCWETVMPDEIGPAFADALATALAVGSAIRVAFDAGRSAVHRLTESGHLDNGLPANVQMFELDVDPMDGTRVNLATGRLWSTGRRAGGTPRLLEPEGGKRSIVAVHRSFEAPQFWKPGTTHTEIMVGMKQLRTQFKDFMGLDLRIRADQCEPRLTKLTGVPETLNQLIYLRSLELSFDIASLPEAIGDLAQLRELEITCAPSLTSLCASIGRMGKLRKLLLEEVGVETLPVSISQLKKLQVCGFCSCTSLRALPVGFGALPALVRLSLSGCSRLKTVGEIGQLTGLVELDLSGCKGMATLPESIGNLVDLEVLKLDDCSHLTTLPKLIGNLKCLRTLSLRDCVALSALPPSFAKLTSLRGSSPWTALLMRGCDGVPDTLLVLRKLIKKGVTPYRKYPPARMSATQHFFRTYEAGVCGPAPASSDEESSNESDDHDGFFDSSDEASPSDEVEDECV